LALQYSSSVKSIKNPPHLSIYLTARNANRGKIALQDLNQSLKETNTLVGKGGAVEIKFHLLDVDNEKSVQEFKDDVEKEDGGKIFKVNESFVLKYK